MEYVECTVGLTAWHKLQHAPSGNNCIRREVLADKAAAAIVDDFCNELLVQPNDDGEGKSEIRSVITSLEEAKKKYSPRCLFAVNECRVAAWNDLEAVDRETYVNRRKDALAKWDSGLVDSGTKEQW